MTTYLNDYSDKIIVLTYDSGAQNLAKAHHVRYESDGDTIGWYAEFGVCIALNNQDFFPIFKKAGEKTFQGDGWSSSSTGLREVRLATESEVEFYNKNI